MRERERGYVHRNQRKGSGKRHSDNAPYHFSPIGTLLLHRQPL